MSEKPAAGQISGIIHVLKVGCRWCDCPEEYGPSTTIYNRFNRWSRKRFWTGVNGGAIPGQLGGVKAGHC